MTPAITALDNSDVSYTLHRYSIAAGDDQTYGERAAQAIGRPAEQVFKTLIAELESKELVVAIVPVKGLLNLRALAKAARAKKALMAAPARAERSTGYVTGGISPFGQRQTLRTFVDASALDFDRVCVSAGKRGLQIELGPTDLVAQTDATLSNLAREGS